MPVILFLLFQVGEGHAQAGVDCRSGTNFQSFLDAAKRGEGAFSAMDLPGLTEAREQALAVLPCLTEDVTLNQAAAFHRLMALAAFTAGDQEQVLGEFHAARRLEPGYQMPETVAPAGHPLMNLYEASLSTAEGELDPIIPPEGGWATADGVRGAARATGISSLVQVYNREGRLTETRFLLPGDPTPAWGPLPFERAQQHRRRVVLITATTASAIAAGTLYGLSVQQRTVFDDVDDPVTDSDLGSLRTRTNTLFFTSIGAGAAALGLGLTATFTW